MEIAWELQDLAWTTKILRNLGRVIRLKITLNKNYLKTVSVYREVTILEGIQRKKQWHGYIILGIETNCQWWL